MVITVFGLGFVGLTTALGFSEYGHTVYGVEIDMRRLSVIQSGKLPFLEPGLDTALERHLNHNFHPVSTDSLKEAILQSDCVYYCVGTPYGKDGQADLTYLLEAIDQTLNVVDDTRFRVLVTKSTIPPSTSIGKIIPFLEEKGITVGDNYGVANNPEFLREGHCWTDFMNADRIVLGVSDDKSENILRNIYDGQTVPVYCVSLNTGEFIKYLSNTAGKLQTADALLGNGMGTDFHEGVLAAGIGHFSEQAVQGYRVWGGVFGRYGQVVDVIAYSGNQSDLVAEIAESII